MDTKTIFYIPYEDEADFMAFLKRVCPSLTRMRFPLSMSNYNSLARQYSTDEVDKLIMMLGCVGLPNGYNSAYELLRAKLNDPTFPKMEDLGHHPLEQPFFNQFNPDPWNARLHQK